MPILKLFLSSNCFLNVIIFLKIDELFNFVLFCKTIDKPHFVFKNSFPNVIRYTNIENVIVFIGENVNTIGKSLSHGYHNIVSEILKQVQDDNGRKTRKAPSDQVGRKPPKREGCTRSGFRQQPVVMVHWTMVLGASLARDAIGISFHLRLKSIQLTSQERR